VAHTCYFLARDSLKFYRGEVSVSFPTNFTLRQGYPGAKNLYPWLPFSFVPQSDFLRSKLSTTPNLKILLPLLLFTELTNSASVSICNQTDYLSQRICARESFCSNVLNPPAPDAIANRLSCDMSPVAESCFCRPDLQVFADAIISSCVAEGCHNDALDVASATGIYDSYCTNAGYLRNATTTTATSTGEGTLVSISTATVTAVQTVSASSGQRRVRVPFGGVRRFGH
jgi:hypothetical protein